MVQAQNESSFTKVREVLSQYTDVESDQIMPESELICDLGLTSFDLVCLGSSLESEFGVAADEKLMKEFKTVADVCRLAETGRKQTSY